MAGRNVSARAAVLALVGAIIVGSCGAGSDATPTRSPTATPTGATSPTGSASPTATAGSSPSASSTASASPSFEGPAYDNPVYPRDFPDPHVILVDDTYYAYSTNVSPSHVPVLSSTDLVTWTRVGDAMPVQAEWVRKGLGFTWAPGVIQLDDGFALYYTARDIASDKQCIGVAISDSPEGRFESQSDEPLICQAELGGSIDAYPFRDADGQLYLYWKNDGNCCGLDVWLWAQRLSDDGLTLEGEPVQLVARDQAWERPLIENPAMVEQDGEYHLFYSGNWWEGPYYAVGYAVCETASGPCDKPFDKPILSANGEANGPGGQSLFRDTDGDLWIAYHAWTGSDVGYPGGERSLRIDPVEFEDGVPVIEGPTVDPQPLP
jgi:beta-xylosidase